MTQMLGDPALGVVAADADAGGVAVVDQVIARRDVAGGPIGVLARELDAEIHVVNEVALDQQARAAVHVNPVGVGRLPIGGVAPRGDVVDRFSLITPLRALSSSGFGQARSPPITSIPILLLS